MQKPHMPAPCNASWLAEIHQPEIRTIDGMLYCHEDDRVESCTVLVEHRDEPGHYGVATRSRLDADLRLGL